jgi:N-acyl-D-amino-acid deacylase
MKMAEPADFVLRHLTIYDGSGRPPWRGDVAVAGERISALSGTGSPDIPARDAVHDMEGLAIAPGFIDAHTHDDRIVLDAPEMLPKISQGVTTVVVGNCGISLAPVTFDGDPPAPMNLLGGRDAYAFPSFAAYAEVLERRKPAVNVAALVGHSALRLRTMKDVGAKASASEVAEMQSLAREAMANGAAGFSTGLFYPTNAGADRHEVASVARTFSDLGGVYATHMRDEMDHVLDSIDEALKTSADAGIPLVVSHHKCAHPRNWGRTRETLAMLEGAAQTRAVNVDVYPYTAGSTNLRADLVTGDFPIRITWSKPYPQTAGRLLTDVAADWNCDLHEAARRLDPAGAIYFQMDEADVQRVMRSPISMIGSDGLPHDQHPHPRLWGTFPRVLGHYARDVKLFSMEEAIHKMTGLTARVFKLEDRGQIRVGAFADLVIFNPRTIRDRATYDSPMLPADGIEHVYVNGNLSFSKTSMTTERAGRLIGGRRQ